MVGAQRFVTAEGSAKIRAVHDYYAGYQFQLAVVLTNYWRTKPAAFSPATIQHYIDEIDANVDKQETERLKPPVPADKFIDTRTMTMWDRKPPWVSGDRYKPKEGKCYCSSHLGYYCDISRDPNWQEAKDLGTEEDFKRLIDGWDLGNDCGPSNQPVPCPIRSSIFASRSDSSPPPRAAPRAIESVTLWLGPTPVPRVRFRSCAVATTTSRGSTSSRYETRSACLPQLPVRQGSRRITSPMR